MYGLALASRQAWGGSECRYESVDEERGGIGGGGLPGLRVDPSNQL